MRTTGDGMQWCSGAKGESDTREKEAEREKENYDGKVKFLQSFVIYSDEREKKRKTLYL